MSDMREKIARILAGGGDAEQWMILDSDYDDADAILAALPGMIPELEWKADYAFLSGWPSKEITGEVSYSDIATYVICADFWNVNAGPDQPVASLEEARTAANTHHRQQLMKALGLA